MRMFLALCIASGVCLNIMASSDIQVLQALQERRRKTIFKRHQVRYREMPGEQAGLRPGTARPAKPAEAL